jgi:outer membrane protein TolC
MTDGINLALANQSAIRQSAAQLEIQKGQVTQSASKLLPGTSVSSSTQVADSDETNITQLSTSASQLIYDFGRSPAGLTGARRQEDASREALAGTTSDVILTVKQAYFNLLQTNHLVEVFAEQLKAQDEHVAEAQARKDAGVAPLADVLKAQAAAASAKVDLVTARRNADLARVALNSAMGVNIRSTLSIEETTEPAPPSLEEDLLVSTALRQRPEVRQSAYLVEANQAAVKVARTDNLPSVTTRVNRNQAFGSGLNGSPNSWDWTLNLSWSPYDSGFTKGAVRSAKAQVVSSQEALYDVTQRVTQDVVQSRLNILAAEEQLTSALAEVASAEENLSVSSGRYEAGVGILLDVLDAQAAFLKAKVDELSARYGLSTARAVLKHAIGATAVEGVGK